MKSVWKNRKKCCYQPELCITLVVFLSLLIWLFIGLDNTEVASKEQQLKNANETLKKSVLLCYSIEGEYPTNVEYLYDNYGLSIDEERYIIHYRAFSSNVMPEIQVFTKY